MRSMLQELKSFVALSLDRSSRTPVDLVPYQHLIWIFEGDASNVGSELPSLVYAMWFAFYTRNWQNTYNIAGKLSRIGYVEKLPVSISNLTCKSTSNK
jgi:hypothetical protein